MKTNWIDVFVEQTGLEFHTGEIGFGRPCVGIINPKTDSYLSYQTYDSNYETALIHEVASGTAPRDAYHKGPYLAVLHDGSAEGLVAATTQLNDWLEKIIAASFDLKEYEETGSFTSLMRGGSVTQLCLAGGITLGRFTEIF